MFAIECGDPIGFGCLNGNGIDSVKVMQGGSHSIGTSMVDPPYVDPQTAPILNAMRERMAERGPLTSLDIENMRSQSQLDLQRWNDLTRPTRIEEIGLKGRFGTAPALLVSAADSNDHTGQAHTIVWCHGGGFVMGSPETHLSLAASLSYAAGCRVVMLRYALAPEHRYPSAIEDVATQIEQLRDILGFGDTSLILGGDSAGAYIALAALLDHPELVGPMSGFIGIYGTYAPPTDTGSYVQFADGFGLTASAMHFFWSAWLNDRSPEPSLDLMRRDLSCIPPSYLLGAGLDPLRDDTRKLAQVLTDCGVDTTLHEVLGAIHGFAHMEPALASVGRAYARLGHFARERFSKEPQ